MEHKSGDNRHQSRLEKRLFFVEGCQDRVHQTHAIQAQREPEQDDMYGGHYSTRLGGRCATIAIMDTRIYTGILEFIVLLLSLSIHESAHAWTADRLGDPTARLLGRVSLNPLVHADPVGTVLFPLIAMLTRVPLIGWAKPVPVNVRHLRHHRRDYVLVAAAGPASNLLLALASALVLAVVPVRPVTLGEPNISVPIASLLSS